MNDWITFFTEVISLMSSCFLDVGYREGSRAETDAFKKITEVLSGFKQRSGKCGFMLIRSTGLGEKSIAAGVDGYELVTRDIPVDALVTPMKIREAGSRMSFFADRLSQAFEVFSANNITSLYVKIPWRLPEDLDRLRNSFRILSGFIQAVKNDSPVIFKKNGKQISIPLVKDEKGRPHPNLTLAMGLNDLDPAKIQDMVNTIDAMVRPPEPKQAASQFIDVYDAMRCSPKFRQLMKPPIELNNVRWLLANSETDTLSDETVQVARMAVDVSEDSPHKLAQILTSIYGNDFDRISARVLGQRLVLITSFFESIPKKADIEGISKEICESILSRFTQVRRDVRNDLMLMDDTLHVTSKGVDIPMGPIHPEFTKMIRFFGSSPLPKEELAEKERAASETSMDPAESTTETSMEEPVNTQRVREESAPEKPIEGKILQQPDATQPISADASVEAASEMEKMVEDRIDQMELGTLMRAEEMEPPPIPTQTTPEGGTESMAEKDSNKETEEDIVAPFKRCFDSKGHFQKGSFEKNIPALSRHREQIFEFIWQYLKGTMNRDDRLALLSSLHLLVNKINQSEQAVSVLLKDIFSEPNRVDISDRNGLMLASLVIRKYNKEFNKEIELTPEEVFLVKEGLIGSAVDTASRIIEKNSKNIMQKHVTVYTGITKALTPDKTSDTSMPFRYLLNLEREACIFLSLVGGPTPRAVIRDAIKMYGDPRSDVYKANGDASHVASFLQHLKILVRGMGRIGEKEDIPVLEDLMNNYKGLMRFSPDQKSQDMIQRIMKWTDDATRHIAETRDTVTA